MGCHNPSYCPSGSTRSVDRLAAEIVASASRFARQSLPKDPPTDSLLREKRWRTIHVGYRLLSIQMRREAAVPCLADSGPQEPLPLPRSAPHLSARRPLHTKPATFRTILRIPNPKRGCLQWRKRIFALRRGNQCSADACDNEFLSPATEFPLM